MPGPREVASSPEKEYVKPPIDFYYIQENCRQGEKELGTKKVWSYCNSDK